MPNYIADPELLAIEALLPKADLNDLAGARQLEESFLAHAPAYQPRRELTAEDLTIDQVPIRLTAARSAAGPLPALIYLRASGFVMGNLASADNAARRLADHLDVIVVTVDYRLAPEHPYPAALEDAYAVISWLASPPAAEHGVDPGTVGVLGDSAGGGLAVAASMLARDRGGPVITAQFLDAPTIDDRCATASAAEFPDTPMWRGADSPVIWRYYLGGREPGGDDVPVYAAPARASIADLRGLPPTWIAAYQIDPTRDEALDLARRLVEAGVPTDIRHHAGAFHMTHTIPGLAISERLLADKYDAIQRLLKISPANVS